MALITQERLQPVEQRLVSGFPHAEDLGDGGRHQTRVADRGKVDEGDAIGEIVRGRSRHAQREAGLADPARTGQRKKRNILTQQQVPHRSKFPLPPNQRGARRDK